MVRLSVPVKRHERRGRVVNNVRDDGYEFGEDSLSVGPQGHADRVEFVEKGRLLRREQSRECGPNVGKQRQD